jgi:hypothetical protein
MRGSSEGGGHGASQEDEAVAGRGWRDSARRQLGSALAVGGSGWVAVVGPRGAGKSTFLREALRGRQAIVLSGATMDEADLLDDFRRVVREELGELPVPRGPGILPDPEGLPGWRELLLGLAQPGRGRRLLVLDRWDELVAARRSLGSEVAEALDWGRVRGGQLSIVIAARHHPAEEQGSPLREPRDTILLGAMPYREAAQAQGGRSARDAFHRWACLGALPAQFPSGDPGDDWEEAVVARVLRPSGDLFDAPLRRLAETFHRPERYASLLRAIALGPVDWGELRRGARAVQSGAQMAPYLRRLEEEEIIRVERPLSAPEGSRRARYRLADPLWGFWMSSVAPVRSRLLLEEAEEVWASHIRPRVEAHLIRWLPLALREWFELHAAEVLPASSREVGAVWGGEAEFDAVAWLTNGQICYGMARWSEGPVDSEPYEELLVRMSRTRYGIGRENRTPVLLAPGPLDPELRRRLARNPLARVLGMGELMGPRFSV